MASSLDTTKTACAVTSDCSKNHRFWHIVLVQRMAAVSDVPDPNRPLTKCIVNGSFDHIWSIFGNAKDGGAGDLIEQAPIT